MFGNKSTKVQGYSYLTLDQTTGAYTAQPDQPRFEKLPPGYYLPDFDYMKSKASCTPLPLSDERTISMGGVDAAVYAAIEKFRTSKHLYRQFKLPYKRGILLHGTPGCGKTKIISKLIQMLVDDGAIGFRLDSHSLDVYKECSAQMRQINKDCLVFLVIEDIEKLVDDSEEELLEVLDGATSSDNQVVIASTNHLDDVPDRIKNRPSRIDLVIEVPEFTDEQATEYVRELTAPVLGSEEQTVLLQEVLGTPIRNAAKLKELVLARVIFDEPIDSAASRVAKHEPDVAD